MSNLQFELFITVEDKQEIITLDHKPVLFGTSSNCTIQVGSGEPKVKAIVQKENDCLLIKTFDKDYLITINGKKYKSAKLKNSVFFKIGFIDIVASIEEINQEEVISEDSSPKVYEEYVEEEREPTKPSITLTNLKVDQLNNQEQQESLPSELPESLQNLNSQPDSIPQEKSIDISKTDMKLPEMTPEVSSEEPVQAASSQESVQDKEVLQEDLEVVASDDIFKDDAFKFNIKFDSDFKPKFQTNYMDKSYDYSNYIDTIDETKKVIPSEEIIEEVKGHCLQIVHMNNGVVLEHENFDPKLKRIFLSHEYSNDRTMQIMDFPLFRNEIIFIRERKVFIVGQKGYKLQKIDKDENVIDIDQPTTQLVYGERVVLSKGTSQIVVEIVPSPPRLKHVDMFDFDERMLKIVSSVWTAVVIPLLLILLIADLPKEKPKEKKEVVIIYKKKKVEKIEQKKQVEPKKEVAKNDKPNEKPVEKKATPQKKPEKKIVKKEPVKKKEVVKKKIAKVNPVKKPSKVPPKVTKKKSVAKKVSKVKKSVVKSAPKKNYKFSSSSKMSAMLGKNNTKLKTVKKKSSVNVASTFGTTESLTENFDSRKFGKSSVKVERFAAGSRVGKSSAVGTKGLSGKTSATTAYIEANTKILGAMDPELIRKIMREYIPQFRHCYQKELMKNSSVAGTFDLIFQINSRGKGVNVNVKKNGTDFSPKAKTCLKRVVKMIKFPRPKGGGLVDVKQPMNFYKQ